MAATFQLAQVTFAQADGLWRDFNQFVIVDKLNCAFQSQFDRRGQADGFISTAGADVGQFFALQRVYHQVVITAVDTDNHAFVDFIVWRNEHTAAVFQVP